ncbi:MAG TPA: beta-ketoacyl-ACP synthase III [Gammaproteobacteria bacterium]|nr:beta-ketoacyl-ACP synthase III [Gammaproteobacteria bacterium]
MKYAKILGTGSYLPPNVMTNADWQQWVDTSDAWIVGRTGIQSRHIASKEDTTATLAVLAATQALAAADCQAKDIQMIIVATGLPARTFPATACLVQQELQIPVCPAFDLQAACSGFIYAMTIVEQFIKQGVIAKALIVGSEIMSRLIDWSNRETCVLFGDGAGAVVLGASDEPGILISKLYADGNYSDLLRSDNLQRGDWRSQYGNDKHPENFKIPLEELNPYIHMEGRKVFKIAVNCFEQMVRDTQENPIFKANPIDWLVPHQANIRIIEATAEKLGLSMDKVICTVAKHSNTSSASIPLALDTAIRDGRIKRGENLLLEALGSGLTWGSIYLKY